MGRPEEARATAAEAARAEEALRQRAGDAPPSPAPPVGQR
jgi:hypothetical protein